MPTTPRAVSSSASSAKSGPWDGPRTMAHRPGPGSAEATPETGAGIGAERGCSANSARWTRSRTPSGPSARQYGGAERRSTPLMAKCSRTGERPLPVSSDTRNRVARSCPALPGARPAMSGTHRERSVARARSVSKESAGPLAAVGPWSCAVPVM
ncbi:hypothetical protein SMICM304S_06069 [Streptomyces microflavus]